jgi:hypothetical protein
MCDSSAVSSAYKRDVTENYFFKLLGIRDAAASNSKLT